jgi:hypothetical protein
MAKKNLFKFNIKNLYYSFATLGEYETPVALAYANSIALEADYDELVLYGDGQKLAVLADDKGKTGTLSVTNIEELYEIACGRAMLVQGGLGDIQQLESKEHALYYEIEGILDGERITIKNWLYGCITGKASESYEQTTDNPTVNNFDYPLTVLGTVLQNVAGTADYTDANGNIVKCFRITSYPTDDDYATFGATVPVAKQPDA